MLVINKVPPFKALVTGWIQSRVIGGRGNGIQAETGRMRKECWRQRGCLMERLRTEREHSFSRT